MSTCCVKFVPRFPSSHRISLFAAFVLGVLALFLATIPTAYAQLTVPSTPINVRCQSGAILGGVVLGFDLGASDGGSSILYFKLERTLHGVLPPFPTLNFTTLSPMQLDGLQPNVEYQFRVAAVNAIGESAMSGIQTCRAGGPPDPPSIPRVTYNLTSQVTTIGWTPTRSAGGPRIVNYFVALYQGSTLVQSHTVTDGVYVQFTQLTTGVPFQFSISTTTSIGTSAAINGSFTLHTTMVAPSSPQSVGWYPFNGGMLVRFESALMDGGSPVTGYSLAVYSFPGNALLGSPIVVAGTSTSIVWSTPALVNGVNYTFVLSATNAAGSTSIQANYMVGGSTTPPQVASNVSVSVLSGSKIYVSWVDSNAAASTDSYFVRQYRITTGVPPALLTMNYMSVAAPTSGLPSTFIDGFCLGRYIIVVEIVSANGLFSSSVASSSFDMTGAAPSVPTYVRALVQSDAITVYFDPPDSGSLILNYIVLYSVAGVPQITSGNSPLVITSQLFNGQTQTFQIFAFSCVGSGAVYTFDATPNAVVVITAPTQITLSVVSSGSQFGIVNTTCSSCTSSTMVSMYEYPSGAFLQTFSWYGAQNNSLVMNITGLVNGHSYLVYAIARNRGGASANSNQVTVLPYGPVDPPQQLQCVSGPQVSTITASWLPPANTGGLPLNGYAIYFAKSGTITSSFSLTALQTSTSYQVSTSDIGLPFTVQGKSLTLTESVIVSSSPNVCFAASFPKPPTIACSDSLNTITIGLTMPTDTGYMPIRYVLLSYFSSTTSLKTVNVSTSLLWSLSLPASEVGVVYDFSAVVYTQDDVFSNPSVHVQCSTAVPPSCPWNVTCESGPTTVGSMTAHWITPLQDGGSALTQYTVSYAGPSGGSRVISAPGNALQISSLQSNALYTVQVTASNRKGASIACPLSGISCQAAGLPAAVPITATPGDQLIRVVFSTPTGLTLTGGVPLSTSDCTATPTVGGVATPPTFSQTYSDGMVLSGLVNGVPYSVQCSVMNSILARSDLSNAVIVTPTTFPCPVTNVSIQSGPGNGQMNVSWLVPSCTGGSPILGFNIYWQRIDSPSYSGMLNITRSVPVEYRNMSIQWAVVGPTVSLTPNSTYNVSVVARNIVAASPIVSSSSQIGDTAGVPCVPTILGAKVGNSSVNVTWIAPTCDGHLPILSYIVNVTLNSSQSTVSMIVPAPQSTVIVPGLLNGAWYRMVTVVARNAAGSSQPAILVADLQPSTLPGAPMLNGTCLALDGAVAISFQSPTPNGGLTILKYQCDVHAIVSNAQSLPWAQGPDVYSYERPGGNDTLVLDGLSDGRNYSVTCNATNANGGSMLSNAIFCSPSTVPDPPLLTDLSAVVPSGSLFVRWNPPAWTGGAPLTSYAVSWRLSTGAGTTMSVQIPARNNSMLLSSLIPNATYCVVVQSVNARGLSQILPADFANSTSNQVCAPSSSPPCPPSNVEFVPLDASFTTNWAAFCDGQLPIRGYFLSYRLVSANDVIVLNSPTVFVQIGVGGWSYTVSGLQNGAVYSVQIQSFNDAGNSTLTPLPASSVRPARPPCAPPAVQCKSGPTNRALTVSWNPYSSNCTGGQVPLGFNITYVHKLDGAVSTLWCTSFSCVNDQLFPKDDYFVSVQGVNVAGVSNASPPINCTAGGVPDPVTVTSSTCIGTDRTLTLSLAQPQTTLFIQQYQFNLTTINGVVSTYSVLPGLGANQTFLLSVPNDVLYQVTVCACSYAGCSIPSVVVNCSAGLPPTVPILLSAVPSNTDALVSYSPPAGGSAVVQYSAEARTAAGMLVTHVDAPSNLMQLTLSSLPPGTRLIVTLWCSNVYGISPNVSVTIRTLSMLPPDNVLAIQPQSMPTPTLRVYFTPDPQPPADPSFAVVFYVVYSIIGSSVQMTVNTTVIPVDLTQLSNAQTYVIQVYGANSYGARSALSAPKQFTVGPINYPLIPSSPFVNVSSGANQSVIAVAAPSMLGGGTIQKYRIYTSGQELITGYLEVNAAQLITFGTIGHLVNGVQYWHFCVADNGAGLTDPLIGFPSQVVTSIPQARYVVPKPIVASTVRVTSLSGRLQFDFLSLPDNPSGSPILGFAVQWLSDASNNASTLLTSSGSMWSMSTTASGVINGVPMNVGLVSWNGAGVSSVLTLTELIPGLLPGAPTNVVGSPLNMSALVFFSPPSSFGSNALLNYYIFHRDAGNSVFTTGIQSPILVDGLINFVANNLTICTVTSVSPRSTSLPLYQQAPSSCTSFTVTPQAQSLPQIDGKVVDGSIIFATPVPALSTSGIVTFNSMCRSRRAFSVAMMCDPLTNQTFQSRFTYRPNDRPVYAFNAFYDDGGRYSKLADSPTDLLQTGIRTSISYAYHFTTFFDQSAPTNVMCSPGVCDSHLASGPAVTGCQADGSFDADSSCSGWYSTSSSQIVVTGKAAGLSTASDFRSGWLNNGGAVPCSSTTSFIYCLWMPTADDGVQDGDETGVDCGGTTRFSDGSPGFPCDVPPPTIMCPAPLTIDTVGSTASGALTLPSFNITSIIRYVYRVIYVKSGAEAHTGDLLPATQSPVTLMAIVTDGKYQQGNCSFTVTVRDVSPPTIICPANIQNLTDSGVNYATGITWPDPSTSAGTAWDNIGVVSISPKSSSTRQFSVGVTNVTLVATDAAGNTGKCVFIVRILDAEPPTVTYCPGSFNLNTEPGQSFATILYPQPTATDNVGLAPGTFNGVLLSGPMNGTQVQVDSVTGLAEVLIRYQFVDTSGNSDFCSFRIQIIDNEKPMITCPADIRADTDSGFDTATLSLANPTAVSDNVHLSSVEPSILFKVGVNVVQISAVDERNNTNTCHYTVTVNDREKPSIICPSNLTMELPPSTLSGSLYWPAPLMADNVGIAGYNVSIQPGTIAMIGTATPVTYVAFDQAGNNASCTFSVSVESGRNPPPVNGGALQLVCPTSLSQHSIFQSNPPIALFTWSMPVIINVNKVVVLSGSAVNKNNTLMSSQTLGYTVVDDQGNQASCNFTASVIRPTTEVTAGSGRAQISLAASGLFSLSSPIELVNTLFQIFSSSLSTPSSRLSLLYFGYGVNSTDVVFEFTQVSSQFSTKKAKHRTASRQLKAVVDMSQANGDDLLSDLIAQLQDPTSAVRTHPSASILLGSSLLNCSSQVTNLTSVRAPTCGALSAAQISTLQNEIQQTQDNALTQCPPQCVSAIDCIQPSDYTVCPPPADCSQVRWYRLSTTWIVAGITSGIWMLIGAVFYFCTLFGQIGDQAVDRTGQQDRERQNAAPPRITFPPATDAMIKRANGDVHSSSSNTHAKSA